MRTLRDRVAESIRGDSDFCESPWLQLPHDRKIGWLGDADRALAVVKEVVGARILEEVVSDDPDIMAAFHESFEG